MKKIIISIFITLPMLFGTSAYAAQGDEITVYMTIEKLTLGQGFIMEPTALTTTEGTSVAEVLEAVMPGQYMHTGTIDDNLYVSAFGDTEAEVNVPEYILEYIGEVTTRQDREWLSEFDYSDTSGWKFSVNNEFPSVSASDMLLNDGDVIRWQFSLYGYGADLGMGGFEIEGMGELADKSELIRAVANGSYSEYALDVLTRLDSSEAEVNDAYIELENSTYAEESGFAGANFDLSANYIMSTVTEPQIAQVGGDWTVLGLARGGIDIEDDYFKDYYKRVVSYIRENNGVVHARKYTEYSRVIMALRAIGKDPTNVYGFDLVMPLTDFDATMKQGLNGAVFALIAMDCCDYKVHEDVRKRYIDEILSRQHENGAFSLSKNGVADIDITAMALSALSNYTEDEKVKNAVERALQYISEVQEADGGFSVMGEKNSESATQIIVALTSLGISPDDERFVKNGNTVLDYLLTYSRGDGGFAHTLDGETDLMATEQAFYALAAAERFNSNKTSLYDMSDVEAAEVVGPKRYIYEISEKKILYLAECLK